MNKKQEDLPKFMKDPDNTSEENYILQDNAKKNEATFIVIVLVNLVLAAVAISTFIDFSNEATQFQH
jgi:hypothetical protein